MLALTATDIDLRFAPAREPRRDRTLMAAIGASLLLHALAIAFLPGFRVTPSAEPKPLTVEFQRIPPETRVPETQVMTEPRPLPPPPKQEAAPKPLPHPAPPPVIERVEPPPPPAPEAFTMQPPPPPAEAAPEPAVAEPAPVPHIEPLPQAKAQPIAPPPASPAPVVAAPRPAEPDPALLRGYGQQLSQVLAKAQRYPRIARMRGWQGTAEVKIRIGDNGKVLDIALGHGSGYDVLDQQALDMVKDSLPLPPPPAALLARNFTIDVPIVFRLQ